MKFVKLLLHPIDYKNRDIREIEAVLDLGYEVEVVCSGKEMENKILDKCKVHVLPLPIFSKYKNRMVRHVKMLAHYFKLALYTKQIGSDIISCHDIFALGIGYVSVLLTPKKRRPLLVYDSHEFEMGRNIKRSKIQRWSVKHIEKFLMCKCTGSIMVNESIAAEVKKIHNLKEMPQVTRNIANFWNIEEEKCINRRKEFCEKLGVKNDSFLIMYHGGIIENRGIEKIIELIQKNIHIQCIILGNGAEEYVSKLKNMAKECGVSERILFVSAVPINVLWEYVGAVDVGMVTIPDTCKSYYYCLPNKLFENIQATTPVIGSDFPEIKKIVKQYDIGLVCDPENVEDINRNIEIMRTDKGRYAQFKKNILQAKQELCWENEKKGLQEFYRNLRRK